MTNNISSYINNGNHLNDTSNISEKSLNDAMPNIIKYAKKRIQLLGGSLVHEKKMTLYQCQENFYEISGIQPNICNKDFSMKPDGGILIAIINGHKYPILIIEDKVQGTNDIRYKEGKIKQALGNAIERGGKNIRGAEMIFSKYNFFPYVLFASGCDFHHSETISKRIEMMNMGYPNNYIEIDSNTTNETIKLKINNIINNISIEKKHGFSIASVFVKAHKWNVMEHKSSLWTKDEITIICCKIIDLSLDHIKTFLK